MAMVEEMISVVGRVDQNGNTVKPDSPKVYLCLLQLDSEERIWDVFKGIRYGEPVPEGNAYYIDSNGELKSTREETYLYLESLIDHINLKESYVMTQNQTMKENITVYSFMRMCLEADVVISKSAQLTLDELDEFCASYNVVPEAYAGNIKFIGLIHIKKWT